MALNPTKLMLMGLSLFSYYLFYFLQLKEIIFFDCRWLILFNQQKLTIRCEWSVTFSSPFFNWSSALWVIISIYTVG